MLTLNDFLVCIELYFFLEKNSFRRIYRQMLLLPIVCYSR